MKRELTYVQMGLSGISLLAWFLLPIYSFIVVIPLFNISGWNLVLRINQLTLFVLLGSILMIVAALMNNRKFMITSAVLEAIIVILTVVFRKNILLGGNFKWIYNSAALLVKKVPEIVGVDTSGWDIQQVITYVVDNLLQFGLGGIIHGICTLGYLIIAICAPEEKPYVFTNNKTGGNTPGVGSGTNSGAASFNPNKTHQNTGYTHRT